VDLEHSINFKGRSKILSLANNMNKLRNDFGHRIVENYSYYDIENKLKNLKTIYEEIFQTWITSQTDLRHLTGQAKGRKEILKLIKDK
jgi:hypothetical protein